MGDKILFDGRSVKGDICYSALMTLVPKIYAMCYGIKFPWAEGDIIFNDCPEPNNPFVFAIRCIRK